MTEEGESPNPTDESGDVTPVVQPADAPATDDETDSSDDDRTAHTPASSADRIDVNVVIAPDVGGDDIIERAAEVGFECVDHLEVLGIAHGTIEPDRLEELRSLPGIASVERDRDVHTWSPRTV